MKIFMGARYGQRFGPVRKRLHSVPMHFGARVVIGRLRRSSFNTLPVELYADFFVAKLADLCIRQ